MNEGEPVRDKSASEVLKLMRGYALVSEGGKWWWLRSCFTESKLILLQSTGNKIVISHFM